MTWLRVTDTHITTKSYNF